MPAGFYDALPNACATPITTLGEAQQARECSLSDALLRELLPHGEAGGGVWEATACILTLARSARSPAN